MHILSAVRDISAFFAALLVLAGAAIQAVLAAGESMRAERALRGSASATRRGVSVSPTRQLGRPWMGDDQYGRHPGRRRHVAVPGSWPIRPLPSYRRLGRSSPPMVVDHRRRDECTVDAPLSRMVSSRVGRVAAWFARASSSGQCGAAGNPSTALSGAVAGGGPSLPPRAPSPGAPPLRDG